MDLKKLSKQTRTETESWIWRVFCWLLDWRAVWWNGEEVRGLRIRNRWLQDRHGDIQYSIGNGVAKELTHMTHGHEQWWGDC